MDVRSLLQAVLHPRAARAAAKPAPASKPATYQPDQLALRRAAAVPRAADVDLDACSAAALADMVATASTGLDDVALGKLYVAATRAGMREGKSRPEAEEAALSRTAWQFTMRAFNAGLAEMGKQGL